MSLHLNPRGALRISVFQADTWIHRVNENVSTCFSSKFAKLKNHHTLHFFTRPTQKKNMSSLSAQKCQPKYITQRVIVMYCQPKQCTLKWKIFNLGWQFMTPLNPMMAKKPVPLKLGIVFHSLIYMQQLTRAPVL